jgi:hypothetical protein
MRRNVPSEACAIAGKFFHYDRSTSSIGPVLALSSRMNLALAVALIIATQPAPSTDFPAHQSEVPRHDAARDGGKELSRQTERIVLSPSQQTHVTTPNTQPALLVAVTHAPAAGFALRQELWIDAGQSLDLEKQRY